MSVTKRFKNLLNLKKMNNFFEIYEETLGEFRDQKALFTYMHKIQSLSFDQRKAVSKAYTTFITSVLSKDFPKIRYMTKGFPHLEKVFSLKPDFQKLWIEKEELTFLQDSFRVYDSDDACELFLIGQEVTNTCLSVNASAELNKCLMGYVLGGDVRAIFVKNRKGDYIARSVLRLMYDSRRSAAVLFLESVYSKINDKRISKWIVNLALKKAEKMGICLLSKEVNCHQMPLYEGDVVFLGGGIAPYTYSDAVGGDKKTKEGFPIYDSRVLFDPG